METKTYAAFESFVEILIETNHIIHNVQIVKTVNNGYGLAYYQGKTIFVENALTGDIADLELLYTKKKHIYAKIHKIIEPSPLRKNRRCMLSDRCGACNWVDIDYENQLKLKNEIIDGIYQNINKSVKIHPIIASELVDFYRNKSFFPLALEKNKPVYGMYQRGSHNVIRQESCFLHPPLYNEIADEIISYIKNTNSLIYDEETHTGNLKHIGIRSNHDMSEILLIIVSKTSKLSFTQLLVKRIKKKFPEICGIIQNIQPAKTNVILGERDKIIYGRKYINDRIGNLNLQIHYKSFFQVNIKQAELMYKQITNLSGNNKTIIDAYSGIGTIGLFLSSKHNKVISIECNPEAVMNAKNNALLNSINNIEFIEGETENVLPTIIKNKDIDLLVFDPPRKGLDLKTIELIAKLKIKEIIYMSCNPITQNRDLQHFFQLGYSTNDIYSYDMFPHTWHIETLCHLKRKAE